ncbi:MAG: hypothetical protein NWS22_05695 [Porticoccaceae bacterium]|nr:hypothetical protein [Porticoccaceae bacterium]
MNKKFTITVAPALSDGKPNYRFYKLVYTAALRFKLPLSLIETLEVSLEGAEYQAKYKLRTTYLGVISLNGIKFENVVYVVDQSPRGIELITFWRRSQRGDAAGSKGGAHQFAEAYLGYLSGKVLQSQIFSPEVVATEISDTYNSDSKFNITIWIIQKARALDAEPNEPSEPIEVATNDPLPQEFVPELLLRNKWKTDVLRSGTFYTNYEVDACIKDLKWGRDERICCQLHWEDGKFLHIEDFGKFDRYTDKIGRTRVFEYLQGYANRASRARVILTVKGDATQWTLASSTMIKRLGEALP